MILLIFFLNFSFSLNFSYQCLADLKSPEPVFNGTLQQIVLITRHGCRAPFDGYGKYKPQGWVCENDDSASPRMSSSTTSKYRRYHTIYNQDFIKYPPSCRNADLTIEGQNMHERLGQFYRSYLIDQLNFLPDYFEPEFLKFRASETERTIRSAESFIHGLYPPETPDDVVSIITGTELLELLHPRVDHCKDFNKVWLEWIQTPEYLDIKNRTAILLKDLVIETGLEWDEWQWEWVGDWLYTIGCCGSPLPDFITQEQLDVSLEAVEFFTLNLFQMKRGVAGASILREVLQSMNEYISGVTNTKFYLMSGHDVSIVSALNVVGVNVTEVPPFASHLSFELWNVNETYYVRAALNGEVLLEPIQYNEFRYMVAPYISYCPELGI